MCRRLIVNIAASRLKYLMLKYKSKVFIFTVSLNHRPQRKVAHDLAVSLSMHACVHRQHVDLYNKSAHAEF